MNIEAIMVDVQKAVKRKNMNFFHSPEAQFESELRFGLSRAKVPDIHVGQPIFHCGKGKMKPDIVVGTVAFELSCRKESPVRGHYKFWRDVWKVEQMANSEQTPIESGFAILLTDREEYWNPMERGSMQQVENWWLKEFFLDDGRNDVCGGKVLSVNWDGNRGNRGKDDVTKALPRVKCTEENKYDEGIGKLTFRGNYKINWQDWQGFSADGNSKNKRFRYLVLEYSKNKSND